MAIQGVVMNTPDMRPERSTHQTRQRSISYWLANTVQFFVAPKSGCVSVCVCVVCGRVGVCVCVGACVVVWVRVWLCGCVCGCVGACACVCVCVWVCVCVCVCLCVCVCVCVCACVCVCVYLLNRSKTCTLFCLVYTRSLLTALLSTYLHRWDPIFLTWCIYLKSKGQLHWARIYIDEILYFDMMHLFLNAGGQRLQWWPCLTKLVTGGEAKSDQLRVPATSTWPWWSNYVWLVLLGFLVSSCCFKIKRNIFFHDFGTWCLSFCLSV